jgi:hypothetical protein
MPQNGDVPLNIDDTDNNTQTLKPRLPPELLEQIVREYALPCVYGDPIASSTLAACSLVNRTFRYWSLSAKFAVIVAPRHVRDFRKWYTKSQNDMQGFNRALFIALDDVSKLTSMSAGWDVEMLKILQQQGPHLLHLSLWNSETRALLRDPAQIRGARVRTSASSADGRITVADVMQFNGARRKNIKRMVRQMRKGKLIQGEALSAIPLKSDFTNRNEAQTRAEMAAAKERARQTLPNWLRLELASKEAAKEVKRRYKAHISADAREYQHEQEASRQARKMMNEEDLRALETLTQQAESFNFDDSESEDEGERGDVEVDWACMPEKLSICPSLPLHEHEEPLNFARMTIWTRVKELDVFVSVPSEVPRCLELISSLVASPLIKFRFSSINASLLISLTQIGQQGGDEGLQQPDINIAHGLQRVLKSHVLRSLLFDEFNNHRIPDIGMLERAISSMIRNSTCTSAMQTESNQEQDKASTKGKKDPRTSLASSLAFDKTLSNDNRDAPQFVRVKILQGNQAHYGKLKDRRQDFLIRALGNGSDPWNVLY